MWFHVSIRSARSRSHVCVGGTKPDPRVHYLAHARARTRARGSARTRAHDGRARIVLVRVSIVYWWNEGDGVMEGNGTEKGSAPRREIGPSLAPSPPAPLAPAALVHFLLSKIMTMLIFLTREEFFKLTCNQTQLWVLGGRERAGAPGRARWKRERRALRGRRLEILHL